jgi:hypothetical protein
VEVVIFVNILACIFAGLNSAKILKNGLLISFIIIFVFLALRYDYGNDYKMYRYFFEELNEGKYDSLGRAGEHFEIGFVYVNKLFKYFGFTFFIAILSLVNCIVIYNLIKKYVPIEYYWLAIFIYVFNPDFMLIHSSAIRQLMAILIVISSLKFLFEKKYFWFLSCIGLAALFHTSAIFMLILMPLIRFDVLKKNNVKIIVVILYALLILLSSFFGDLINVIVKSYFSRYEIYSDAEGEVNSGLGFLIYFVLLVFLLISNKKMSVENRKMTSLTVTALLLAILGIKIMMIFRLNMYLTVFSIVTFPLMVSYLKNKLFKMGVISLILVLYLYAFSGFFKSEIYGEYFEEYHTIFTK